MPIPASEREKMLAMVYLIAAAQQQTKRGKPTASACQPLAACGLGRVSELADRASSVSNPTPRHS
jgi:hypothetical protein